MPVVAIGGEVCAGALGAATGRRYLALQHMVTCGALAVLRTFADALSYEIRILPAGGLRAPGRPR